MNRILGLFTALLVSLTLVTGCAGWQNSDTGTVLGGVLGGAAGSQVGSGSGKTIAFALPLTLVCAILSWHLVERPALSLKQGFGGARRPLPAGVP